MKQKFTRKELYDLVWSTPLITLAKMYNISDNGLRKMCVRMSIPLPKTGHWQKVQHGRRPKIKTLPSDYRGDETVELELVTEGTVRASSLTDEVKSLQLQIELEIGEKLIVPKRLTNPDKLIQVTMKSLAERNGWASNDFRHFDKLSISTSDRLQSRALRFFDTLIKVLRLRKHDIRIGYRATEAILFGQRIEIKLNEKRRMVRELAGSYPSTTYKPTGILYFTAASYYGDKIWTDGKVKLEEQITDIVAHMEGKARIRFEESKIREIEQQKREEVQRIQKELEQRQDLELNNFKLLLKKTKRWQRLKLLRAYIDDVETGCMERNRMTQEIKEWVEWARRKADWYDPTIEAQDELMANVNKETLTMERSQSRYW